MNFIHKGKQSQSKMQSKMQLQISSFKTELGYVGLIGVEGAGRDKIVHDLLFGDATEEDLFIRIQAMMRKRYSVVTSVFEQRDWHPECRLAIELFAKGEQVDLSLFNVQQHAKTLFQKKVMQETQKLSYGETVSYSEIAKRANSIGAARAVGSVMSGNRIPLLIPCHRVTSVNGKLGGYTSPQGTNMKACLLEMEAVQSGVL